MTPEQVQARVAELRSHATGYVPMAARAAFYRDVLEAVAHELAAGEVERAYRLAEAALKLEA